MLVSMAWSWSTIFFTPSLGDLYLIGVMFWPVKGFTKAAAVLAAWEPLLVETDDELF